MLTFVDVNNPQQLHENVKLKAIPNGKHAAKQIIQTLWGLGIISRQS